MADSPPHHHSPLPVTVYHLFNQPPTSPTDSHVFSTAVVVVVVIVCLLLFDLAASSSRLLRNKQNTKNKKNANANEIVFKTHFN